MNHRTFRIFNLFLKSRIRLPGLHEVNDGAPFIEIDVLPGTCPSFSGFNWVHDWKSRSGQVVTRCYRRDRDEYRLSFPGVCEFVLLPSRDRISVYPSEDVTDATVAHLVVDQVVPRFLGHAGRVIAHASAVLTRDRRALAFLGPSGMGKSTLASAFLQAGYEVISDDCLLLDVQGGQAFCLPAYPSIRLWPESARRLFPDSNALQTVAEFTDKQQLFLNGGGAYPIEPVPIAAVFSLESPSVENDVEVEPVKGQAVAMKLIESAFVLDLQQKKSVEQTFMSTTRIARSEVPFYSLAYPRRYEILNEVIARVLRHVQA